jgi:hypothetical protein
LLASLFHTLKHIGKKSGDLRVFKNKATKEFCKFKKYLDIVEEFGLWPILNNINATRVYMNIILPDNKV